MRNSKMSLAVTLALLALPVGVSAQVEGQARLSVHGYMTQGMGRSTDLPVMGIGTATTTDYRSAALQLRYDLSARDRVVMQVSHRRLGSSPFMTLEENVELDWAFIHHQFNPSKFGSLLVRAGRFPMARGIYNEVRDVGTILPFYRAPYNIYPDGTETVDGAELAHSFGLGDWGLESRVYWGGHDIKLVLYTPQSTIARSERIEAALGGQLWVHTPLKGLRLGISGTRSPDVGRNHKTGIGSIDADFDRFMARAEYKVVDINEVGIKTYYAHGRVKLIEQLHLLAQYEVAFTELRVPFVRPERKTLDDRALGINYQFSPNLVLKMEGHQRKGFDFDRFVNPSGPAASTRYGVASVSVSF